MNREYLSAKAELCSKLAVDQINNGNEEEGVKNFKRMIRALGEIHLLDIEERRGKERRETKDKKEERREKREARRSKREETRREER